MSFPFHKSLRCAARGLLSSLWRERNLRIHTVAAGYVLFFSAFFDLSFEKRYNTAARSDDVSEADDRKRVSSAVCGQNQIFAKLF